MQNKKVRNTIIIILVITFLIIIYNIYSNKKENLPIDNKIISSDIKAKKSSNLIKDLIYSSKDIKGNEYVINAIEGEIDLKNPNIIFLSNVSGRIILNDGNIITITSNDGIYNSENYDTIFSKNVKINYLDNKITSEHLDFSLLRNKMIISENVIYYNTENKLVADVVEVTIDTKDTKIYMLGEDRKVNLKSIY